MVDGNSCVSDVLQCFRISCLSVSKVEVLEGSMEGNYLVITCTLTLNAQQIPTHTLINCRVTGITFMDQIFALHYSIPLQELMETRQIQVIDRRPIESGDIAHIAKVDMTVQHHKEQVPMFVTKLGIILLSSEPLG